MQARIAFLALAAGLICAPTFSASNPPNPNWQVLRPFSEIEHTGYVALSEDDQFEMATLRETIAKNLPRDVTLLITVDDPSDADRFRREYSSYLGADRLKFVLVPEGGDQFWSRDSLPFPVYLKPGGASTSPTIGLVASQYPQDFDPNDAFAQVFKLPIIRDQQYFRGGNLLFDLQGNCFAENSNEVPDLYDPEGFFRNYFGCKSLTLFDYSGGKGDIDERVKFLEGNQVLADNADYADILRKKGYDVHMMPTPGVEGETYMNTLLVNGTIFVPQMGTEHDDEAVKAYSDLGFNAVPVFTKSMADEGDGNIHCVTMNYPPGTFTPNMSRWNFVQLHDATRRDTR